MFRYGDTGALDPSPDESDWEYVNLPHTWNSDAYVVKDYRKGEAWYRKQIELPESWRCKRVIIRFDGVNKGAILYVNGKKAGIHKGGYTAFACDITSYLRIGTTNVVAVRVDNSLEDTPPVSGDFTFFGGIYRDVWLIAVSDCHFNLTNMASDGVFVSTSLSDGSGSMRINGEVCNDSSAPVSADVSYSVYAPDGNVVLSHKEPVTLKGNSIYKFEYKSKPIYSPSLWSPENPALYRVCLTITDRKSLAVLDKKTLNTAFRTYEFDAEQGFKLNGKPYKLRGVCRHQDMKPIGTALSDEMHRRDFRIMKDMGANFVRLAHYPQDDAFLEMCDKMGMLVWEEIPVIDIVPETDGYADCCEQNLREMIRQHYNHPSIILWGYMNEILLVTLRRFHGNDLDNTVARTIALAERLEGALKEEDTTRRSVMAFHANDAYNRYGISNVVDVTGWNVYSGWYGGKLDDFERFIEKQHTAHPNHPIIVSEYGAGSDNRLHTQSPSSFDFSMEYQQLYVEHYLPVIENTPYISGASYWNLIDFSSASRDEAMPRINNKGLLYSDRTPKDVYYYYKSAWRSDIPVVHIVGRDWNKRVLQCDSGTCVSDIKVYTNLDEVELWADGKYIGRERAHNHIANFRLPVNNGETHLMVRGNYNGEDAMDLLTIQFVSYSRCAELIDWETCELSVNVGSDCSYTSSESGLTWLPDMEYKEGSWGYVKGNAVSTQTEVRGTSDNPLYQTMRDSIAAYRFDVPKGIYEVELLYADIFKYSDNDMKRNAFKVCINGAVVEHNFIPSVSNGVYNAVRRRYIAESINGGINVEFSPLCGKTFLSGIKIRKI
jgi:beta-galactosidase